MWRNESSTEMESWKEGRRGGAGERTHARGSILEGNTALPHSCMYVCMYDYIAVSTRTLTPPTTGTD